MGKWVLQQKRDVMRCRDNLLLPHVLQKQVPLSVQSCSNSCRLGQSDEGWSGGRTEVSVLRQKCGGTVAGWLSRSHKQVRLPIVWSDCAVSDNHKGYNLDLT